MPGMPSRKRSKRTLFLADERCVAHSMSPEDAKSLESWVALSREMVELARAEEWDQLAQRESIRQQQIRLFFKEAVPAADAAQVKASIDQVLAMDETVQQLAEHARDVAARSMGELKRGSQAVKAYTA